MTRSTGAKAGLQAMVALAVVGALVSGCSSPAASNPNPTEDGATPATPPAHPSGTLNNGLTPESWGETS